MAFFHHSNSKTANIFISTALAAAVGCPSYSWAQTSNNGVETVIVSAEKRDEDIQNTPVPVTVVSGGQLAQNDQVKLTAFFDTVPGLVVSPTSVVDNEQMVSIRGIATGIFGNPTVSTMIDDVPFGGFTRELAPNIDPSDLQRVEVLRGPQGTLYGANSMGGLIKYVTKDASTDGFTALLQTDINGVHNGAEAGFGLRGAVNIPLADNLAIRVSAFTRQDAGYIDNPVNNTFGVNEVFANGGRVAALWRISDNFTMKLSAIYQDTKGNGNNDVDIGTGLKDLQQNYVPGAGKFDSQIQAYSATLNGSLGIVDIASITGYNILQYQNSEDYSYFASYVAQAKANFGVTGVTIENLGHVRKFSQELRATAPLGKHVDLLVGGFFTNEFIPLEQPYNAVNPVTGAFAGLLDDKIIPIGHQETAAFTDLTVHITDDFDIQLGSRFSHLKENYYPVPDFGVPISPLISTSKHVLTYLATPEYHISSDWMVYARIATGYRPGRSNSFNLTPGIPSASSPDKTNNYEIGTKGTVWDGLLSFDASLYYIDFVNLQFTQNSPNGASYFTNGGEAKSEGVELSLTLRPWAGTSIGGWVSYDDAVLTQSFPVSISTYGPTGSRLPYSARYSANISANQEFPITNTITGHVGGVLTYMGDRLGPFEPTAVRANYPEYAQVDLHAGADFDHWEMNLYVNNLMDVRGALGGGLGSVPPTGYLYTQPRTVGMSIIKNF